MTKLNALIVDDKKESLLIIGKLLSAIGVDSQTASSGEAAVKLVLESEALAPPFDFLMLDIHMPGISGIEVAKTVRAGGYKGAIFAFTAHPTMDGIKKGGSSGIDAFLSKITLKKELLQALIDVHVKK